MKPICVDLDNTLIFADSMFLLWLNALNKSPIIALNAAFIFLFTGSAEAKHYLTCHVNLDIANLPYNDHLIAWLKKQKDRGHPIWLVTGANQFIANRIALHLGIFDGVLASDKQNNLVSQKKATSLKNHFHSFVYIGDHKHDLAVWDVADESGIVCRNKIPPFKRPFKYIFNRPQATHKDWANLLKTSHWIKNLLIWLPILLQHQLTDIRLMTSASIATISLCLFASIGYIFNDAVDIHNDSCSKRHKNRPFSSGILDIPSALKVACVMLLCNILLMLTLPVDTQLGLYSYFFMSLFYTLFGKKLVILDIFILASLYALRIEIGCTLTQHICSPELSLAILFLSLGLACAKRYSDLSHTINETHSSIYQASDNKLLLLIGICASGMGVMMSSDFLRYFINHTDHFKHPDYLFLSIPLVLYWQFKTWHYAYHKHTLNDPVNYIKKDISTFAIFILFVLIILFAS